MYLLCPDVRKIEEKPCSSRPFNNWSNFFYTFDFPILKLKFHQNLILIHLICKPFSNSVFDSVSNSIILILVVHFLCGHWGVTNTAVSALFSNEDPRQQILHNKSCSFRKVHNFLFWHNKSTQALIRQNNELHILLGKKTGTFIWSVPPTYKHKTETCTVSKILIKNEEKNEKNGK